MSIPYRTRRTLNRLGTVLTILILIGLIGWLCWVVWLQRYVVYTSDGATGTAHLDFSRSANDWVGEVATPPVVQGSVDIFFNEGADAIGTPSELTQLSGYYITSEMFQKELDDVLLQIQRLPAGTTIMIDMKGPYGSFFYDSKLSDAVMSQSTNISQVASLLQTLKSKGFYLIARICAFRDWNFGNNHVSSGLYMLNKKGLWLDGDGYFWLDPTSSTTTNWISSVVIELRDMGFQEVMLADFRFPNSDKYIFTGDKPAALESAAKALVSACAAENFVLSFGVDDPAFNLPDERSRIFLEGVDGSKVESVVSKSKLEDPNIRMVFLCDSGDTRYDNYSVLRSLSVAEEVEARKGN